MANQADDRLKLTPENIDRIVQLYAEGKSQNTISALFSVDRSTIRYHLSRARVYRIGFTRAILRVECPTVEQQEIRMSAEELIRKRVIETLRKRNASEQLIQSTLRIELESLSPDKINRPKSYVDYLIEDRKRRGVSSSREELQREFRHKQKQYDY